MSEVEVAEGPPGLVCTFYSFKGGVGRSMALANVGVVMAAEGHRVLLVDWDLEAPGLEVCFVNAAVVTGDPLVTPGVIDLIEARAAGAVLDWRRCLLKAEFLGHSLDVITAGQKSDDYRRRVQALNWDKLFREHRIGNYVNELREEWRRAYDFVLIDSRTGITDIGDICTVLLPDILVLLFVTNRQNVDGVKGAMARAVAARAKLPLNRSKLLGVPVPARAERDREYEKSGQWQRTFAEEFGDLYREWLPKEVKPEDALNRLFIPYVARWSFGERIPVVESERERADPTSLGAAYARLATLLAHRLDWYAMEGRGSAGEAIGTRLELAAERTRAREAEFMAKEAQQLAARTRSRLRWWVVAALLILFVAAAAGYRWYVTRPVPTPTELLVGERLLAEGKASEALKVFQARLRLLKTQLAEVPDDAEVLRSRVVTLNRIGYAQQELGRATEAVASYRAARAIIDKLLAKDPGGGDLQSDLATNYIGVGQALMSQGKSEEALKAFQASQTVSQKLVARDPENSDWQYMLSLSHAEIGGALEAETRFGEALSSYEADRAVMTKLVANAPANTGWQGGLAGSHLNIGRVLKAQGRYEGAMSSLLAAKAILDRLVAREPDNADWQWASAVCHYTIGRLLETQGRLEEALRYAELDRQATTVLIAKDPGSDRLQQGLAMTEVAVGRVHESRGELRNALESYEAARATADEMAGREPDSGDRQGTLAYCLECRGRVFLAMKRPDDALVSLEQAEVAVRRALPMASARQEALEIYRYLVDAHLLTHDSRSAQGACDDGRRIARAVKVLDDNRLYWLAPSARLEAACAEVPAAAGSLVEARKILAAAEAQLRSLSLESPSDVRLRLDAELAQRRLAELRP